MTLIAIVLAFQTWDVEAPKKFGVIHPDFAAGENAILFIGDDAVTVDRETGRILGSVDEIQAFVSVPVAETFTGSSFLIDESLYDARTGALIRSLPLGNLRCVHDRHYGVDSEEHLVQLDATGREEWRRSLKELGIGSDLRSVSGRLFSVDADQDVSEVSEKGKVEWTAKIPVPKTVESPSLIIQCVDVDSKPLVLIAENTQSTMHFVERGKVKSLKLENAAPPLLDLTESWDQRLRPWVFARDKKWYGVVDGDTLKGKELVPCFVVLDLKARKEVRRVAPGKALTYDGFIIDGAGNVLDLATGKTVVSIPDTEGAEFRLTSHFATVWRDSRARVYPLDGSAAFEFEFPVRNAQVILPRDGVDLLLFGGVASEEAGKVNSIIGSFDLTRQKATTLANIPHSATLDAAFVDRGQLFLVVTVFDGDLRPVRFIASSLE